MDFEDTAEGLNGALRACKTFRQPLYVGIVNYRVEMSKNLRKRLGKEAETSGDNPILNEDISFKHSQMNMFHFHSYYSTEHPTTQSSFPSPQSTQSIPPLSSSSSESGGSRSDDVSSVTTKDMQDINNNCYHHHHNALMPDRFPPPSSFSLHQQQPTYCMHAAHGNNNGAHIYYNNNQMMMGCLSHPAYTYPAYNGACYHPLYPPYAMMPQWPVGINHCPIYFLPAYPGCAAGQLM